MNIVKKLSVTAVAGLLGLGAVGQANAVCTVTGKVVRAYSTNADWAYYYIAPLNTGLIAYNWFFLVPAVDPYNMQTLATANAGGHTVNVTGNAATCPATGTFRNGGTVTSLNVYPLY